MDANKATTAENLKTTAASISRAADALSSYFLAGVDAALVSAELDRLRAALDQGRAALKALSPAEPAGRARLDLPPFERAMRDIANRVFNAGSAVRRAKRALEASPGDEALIKAYVEADAARAEVKRQAEIERAALCAGQEREAAVTAPRAPRKAKASAPVASFADLAPADPVDVALATTKRASTVAVVDAEIPLIEILRPVTAPPAAPVKVDLAEADVEVDGTPASAPKRGRAAAAKGLAAGLTGLIDEAPAAEAVAPKASRKPRVVKTFEA